MVVSFYLREEAERKPETCFVDREYKRSGMEDIKALLADQNAAPPRKRRSEWGRNSVEPIIGHLKSDGKLRRCFLKGILGDAINVILSARGQNLRKLLKWLNFILIRSGFYSEMKLIPALLPQRLENEMAFQANNAIIQDGEMTPKKPALCRLIRFY